MADIIVAAAASSEKKTRAKNCPTLMTAPTLAAQCSECKKWRVIYSQQQYEEIRANIEEVPFTCKRLERVSCNDPSEIKPENGYLWSLDKPSLPKTPLGFKRRLSLRSNLSRLEVYYETPTTKILRRPSHVAPFLSEHPEYSHLSLKDFNFEPPTLQKGKKKKNKGAK